MAIQYVGGTTKNRIDGGFGGATISLTSLTGGIASAPSAGDIVIVVYSVGSTSDLSIGVTTSGYTEIVELYRDAPTVDTNLSVSWKRMGSTPDTSVSVTVPASAADGSSVCVQVYRGVDATTPFDVTATTQTDPGTSPNPPEITPVTSGALILAAGACGFYGTGMTFTASYLSNFIQIYGDDTNDTCAGIGNVAWTSGPYNPAAWTASSSPVGSSAAAVTMALRPQTTASISVSVTGVSATGSVGSTNAAGSGVASAAGVSTTGSSGQAGAAAGSSASVDGVVGSGSAGSVTVRPGATFVPVSGVSASATTSSVFVQQNVTVSVATPSVSALVDSVIGKTSYAAAVSGVESSAEVSTVQAKAGARAVTVGQSISATSGSATSVGSASIISGSIFSIGYVSQVLVWGTISPAQNPDYSDISPDGDPNYMPVDASQAAGYVEVVPAQNPGYSPVTSGDDPNWTPVIT